MRRLLVTGGAGFIGSNFVYFWKKKCPADLVVVLDALTYAGNIANLDAMKNVPGFEFVHGDILDTKLVERIFTDQGIDTLVHFAAESHVDRSIHGPDAFVRTNVTGTLSLLNAAKAAWLDRGSGIPHRFHHVSTDEVYGTLGPDDPPFSEETPYAPNSPYAASKAGSDHLVRAFHKTYGLVTTTSNCSNNYGPFQFPEKLIPLCIANILDGKSLPVYGDGRQIRDWLYVDDHNRGIELILEKGQAGETYNIGGSNECMNIEIVRLICDLTDLRFRERASLSEKFPKALPAAGRASRELISHVRDRAGHDQRYAIDARKIKTALGYHPKESFEAGIQKTVDWYLDHENWWRALMDTLCFSKT
ncbi:dTDP-glucose 4,6-dehydratase [Desulfobacter vibrioformis]|uniref:dTDP-glucose 4,6-dehydratase n=1 Tax=Desulfobacter vibrioformis TaxID=34031 RepID=UPI000551FBD7|nr:dTDP-glucose 4,6-dehydratase [Desulfobacter vibrioformis]